MIIFFCQNPGCGAALSTSNDLLVSFEGFCRKTVFCPECGLIHDSGDPGKVVHYNIYPVFFINGEFYLLQEGEKNKAHFRNL